MMIFIKWKLHMEFAILQIILKNLYLFTKQFVRARDALRNLNFEIPKTRYNRYVWLDSVTYI